MIYLVDELHTPKKKTPEQTQRPLLCKASQLLWPRKADLSPEWEFSSPPVTQHKHVLQSRPLWLIWKERSAFRESAPLTPFALVTKWKGEHKRREKRESGPFRSTQPEAMKIAWFQRHTCMAKHGTGRYGRCWNKTHLMFLHVWGRKQEHIFRVWPNFLSSRGLKASSELCFSGWFQWFHASMCLCKSACSGCSRKQIAKPFRSSE